MDMWAIGCIIVELIKFTNKVNGKESLSTKSAVFPGVYSFPLTPKGESEDDKD